MLIPLEDLARKYDLHISGVLHVGAHEGEENDAYLKQGIPQSAIYWVEANPALCYRLAQRLPNVIQAAVSDTVEQVTFHITNNYQSSSILELKDHLVEHPHIHTIESIQLTTSQLDSIVDRYSIRANFLNMDIQGAEGKCLAGFEKHISMIDYVYTEVNTKELYAGCSLLGDMDRWFDAHGFERKELSMTSHGWGDAFYMRKSQKKKWLLVDRDNHKKNKAGLALMCKDTNVDLTISNNPDDFSKAWEVVIVPSTFIDPICFANTTNIVYGPHNFIFVEGVWKKGSYTFPKNCCYNLLSDWVIDMENEMGGLSLQPKALPFPVEMDVFCPANVPKTLDCFVYFKNRHSAHLATALMEIKKRNLVYKVITYGSYSEAEFLHVVRSSRFGVWIGSHESQGFALEEALSCNTPLLVWDSKSMFDEYVHDTQTYKGPYKLIATSHPYWDETCGISFSNKEDLGQCLDRMVESYSQFQPRAYIKKVLSPTACMNRFVIQLGLDRPDIFVVTSVINAGQNPWSYAVRSVYSTEERFHQTLETIESIRTRVPGAKILIAECSDLPEEYESVLRSKSDFYMNFSDDEARDACLKSEKKGFGEAIVTKRAFEFILATGNQYNRIFKISGRYSLNDEFLLDKFSNTMFTFRKSVGTVSISTRLFSVPSIHARMFCDILNNTVEYYKTHKPTSYEEIVPQQCLPRKDIDVVGVRGYIAVSHGEMISE